MAKPKKIEEPAGTYVVSQRPPVKPHMPAPTSEGVSLRYADPAKVRKANARLMLVHREVLKKLAQ